MQGVLSRNGITEWFNSQYSSLYHDGYTYFCFADNSGKIKFKSFNEKTGQFSDEITLKDFGVPDDHSSPGMVLLQNNELLIFYSLHSSPLFVRNASVADLTSWGSEVVVESGNASYPQPLQTSNGQVWVFYRLSSTSFNQPFVYRTSTDNGASWSNYTEVGRSPTNDEWFYGWVSKGSDDSIHVMLNPLEYSTFSQKTIGYIYTFDGVQWKKRNGENVIGVPGRHYG